MSSYATHGGGVVGNQTVTEAGVMLLEEDKFRNYALMRNQSTENEIWLAIGAEPEVDKGILILPGEFYEMTADNLTHAYIKAISRPTKTALVSYQIGH